jgi:DDE_Tnp_1-associated/Transposase DDE domain
MGLTKPLPAGPPAPAGSLAEALATVPDPRRPYGWNPRYEPLPLVGLLQLTVVATLCGARGQLAVAQWGRERLDDDPGLLQALGLPPGRSPCVATLHRVFKALDVAAFEAALGGWLARTGVKPRDAVALDGKALRGSERPTVPGTYLVAAYAHAAGAVLAQVRPAGKGHELAAAKAALKEVPLAGRLVTGDALLTQRDLCEQVVADGGDYLLPVDENQPALLADAEAAFSPVGPGERARAGRADAAAVAPAGAGRAGRAPRRGRRRRAEGPARPA